MDSALLMGLAVALGLGLLVGMQREWKASGIAGVRTFALVSLLGAVLSALGGEVAPWAVAAGMLAVTALLVLANLAKLSKSENDVGLTTEVAALLIYAVGAAAGQGLIVPAIVVGGATAVLLHWKKPLHSFVDSLGESDLRGVIQLALIGLVILPILPDETYGPYDVLNPYRIWLMVVLIVGISLCAYLVQRALGEQDGAILGGILGGLISSTATSISYARNSTSRTDTAWLAALVIMIASTIANARALFEIGVVAPSLLSYAVLPLVVLTVVMTALCVVLWLRFRGQKVIDSIHENPAHLRAAMIFGLLYAAILFIVAVVKTHFGDRALYLVAGVSGLIDINAITLSTAQLFGQDRIEGPVAWRVILTAILSNLVFKAAAVAMLGSRKLAWMIATLFGISLLAGIALILFWPEWALELPKLPQSSES